VIRDLRQVLVSSGLYEKEADAMIKTWRDSWFEEGMRIFYILPRGITDSTLPLQIDPQAGGISARAGGSHGGDHPGDGKRSQTTSEHAQ
jgi:hypothetical protein